TGRQYQARRYHEGVDAMSDEARDRLLADAEKLWSGGDEPALDVPGFLRAYYRRVATEDLAPPAELMSVARAHASLAVTRPQGRALVRVSQDLSTVDLVTDDMPYLVDSVTTELNRHLADINVILHPLLRVRRDVTGALRGIRGVNGDRDTEPDELVESWIHVEIGHLAGR